MEEHSSSPSGPFDPLALRKAFGGFVTGVTVVTVREADGTPRGLTANSFTSVSMDPPLILVCIDHRAASHPVFAQARSFAVSVLRADQRDISKLFASKAPSKFDHCTTFAAVTDTPIVGGAICWFDCTVHQAIDAGDHLMMIGQVVAFDQSAGTPLAYCRGNYIDFGLEQEAIGVGRDLAYGAIADLNGRVLLTRSASSGRWSIPYERAAQTCSDRPEHAPGGLSQALRALGAATELSFLYSVFDEGSQTFIVYRGVVTEDVPSRRPEADVAFFSADELPWSDLASTQVSNMLRRYFAERGNDRFGIYTDSSSGGSVAMLDGAPTPWSQHASKLGAAC